MDLRGRNAAAGRAVLIGGYADGGWHRNIHDPTVIRSSLAVAKEIWAIRIRLQLEHRARELALFNLAIDSKLRGCDLVGLRVHDVVQGSHVATRAIVMQKKTQRPVQFEITEQTREAVASWVKEAHRKPEQFLFPSRVSESPHLSVQGAERRSKIDAANPRQWILSIRP